MQQRTLLAMMVALASCTIASAQGLPAADPTDHARAGWPQDVSKRAHPSNNPRYIGYYVGGGALSWRRGDLPSPDEGTWGWDYRGGVFKRRVNLLWLHGKRPQGGSGAYQTDGPRLPTLPPSGHQ